MGSAHGQVSIPAKTVGYTRPPSGRRPGCMPSISTSVPNQPDTLLSSASKPQTVILAAISGGFRSF